METPEFSEARTALAQSVLDHVGTEHPPGVAPAAMAAVLVAVCRASGLGELHAFILLENALTRVETTPKRRHG